jgi:hypothetical protein
MTQSYFLIGSLMAGFALLLAFMFITSRVPVWMRAFVAAIGVGCAILIWINSTALMGYPVKAIPHEGDTILDIHVDDEAKAIYLLVEEGRVPRLHQILFNLKLANDLIDAQLHATQTNGRLVFHRGGTGSDRNSSSSLSYGADGDYVEVVPVLPEKQ